MAGKQSQKVTQEGFGTDNPKESQNIVSQGKAGHKVPALGAVGSVPDRNTPDSVKGAHK